MFVEWMFYSLLLSFNIKFEEHFPDNQVQFLNIFLHFITNVSNI